MRPLKLTNEELGRLIQCFIRDFLCGKSQETKGTYQRALREFQKFFSLDTASQTFEESDIIQYKDYLTFEKKLSPSSVGTYLTSLRRLLDYFVEEGLIRENHAKKIKGSKRPSVYSIRPLYEGEIKRVLSRIPLHLPQGLRDYLMIRLMVESAVYEHELSKASIRDLKRHLSYYLFFVQAKGKKTKDEFVKVSLELGDRVNDYISLRQAGHDGDNPIFVSHSNRSNSNRMTPRAIHYRLTKWLHEAGIVEGDVSPSSFRHSAAMLWLTRDNISLEEVRKRMRHRDLSTTRFYLRGNKH